MEITFLHDATAWQAVAEAWDESLKASAVDVPFLRYGFLRAWWSTFGGGEWPDGELWIGVGRDGGRSLQAAPLFCTTARPDSLLLLGTSEIADYLDLITEPARIDEFAASLLAALEREAPGRTLDLWNILETSPTAAALARAAAGAGWSFARQRLKPCPRILLDGGWEAYLARLDKKQRHELRRKMRRVEATPGAEYVRAGPGPELAGAVEAFLRLMTHDEAKAGFLTPRMHAMFHALTEVAAREGWLRLEFLRIDGRPAAGALCFEYGDRLMIYNSGLDPAFLALSPGWALLGHLIRSAAEGGKREVDFLRGGEEYKFRLGGEARFVERLTLRKA